MIGPHSIVIVKYSTVVVLEVSTGPGRMRAGPGLTWAGRAERFYNLLGIRAGFLQSFTRTNFLTN